ncbi:MAG: 50S ribosomal protein L11 methyltransferase [Clostridia bacterium]|nr:50S ribosomal protein L11 methyltransferase [Clostridia bacterium]
MEWVEVKIITNSMGIEPITGVLYNIGISGIIVSDKEDFAQFLENNRKYWDYVDEELERLSTADSSITLYLPDDSSGAETLALIRSTIDNLRGNNHSYGSLEILVNNVKDEDWSENWKKFFHPLPIGEKVLIVPEWEQESVKNPENRIIFTINPGLSFGTGSHESTQMCIEEIEKAIKAEDSVLDLGCGSGILSVISLLLGAKNAVAVDIDDKAVEVAFSNLNLNNLSKDKMTGYAGDVTCDADLREKIGKGYDIVVANIVADVIIAISPFVRNFMKEGGTFICSGIINERQGEVKEALEKAGLICKDLKVRNEWSAIICK